MITPFENKVWLASPTMHGEELTYITEAYETNWMSTVGKNINEAEKTIAEKVGVTYGVALASGTASLHLAGRHPRFILIQNTIPGIWIRQLWKKHSRSIRM